MNTVQNAIEFFAQANKTHSVELTYAELSAIKSALSDKMYEVISDKDADYDVKKNYFNYLKDIREKLEIK
jgi:hypothetical protein